MIHDAASEHRNSAALAMSSGSPNRRSGNRRAMDSSRGFPQGPGELRLDQPGGEGVDPHPRAELPGQLAGEVDDGRLGHVVPADAALDRETADGGQVEDHPAPIGHAGAPGGLGPVEVAGLVDPDRLFGAGRVQIDDRPVVGVGGGVVDQDVDGPEPVDGGGHARLGLLGVPGVGHMPGHLSGPLSRRRLDGLPGLGQRIGLARTRSSPGPRPRPTMPRWPGRSPGTPR